MLILVLRACHALKARFGNEIEIAPREVATVPHTWGIFLSTFACWMREIKRQCRRNERTKHGFSGWHCIALLYVTGFKATCLIAYGNALTKEREDFFPTCVRLDLHLGEAVFPDSDEWCDPVLAVVHQDNPKGKTLAARTTWRLEIKMVLTFHRGPWTLQHKSRSP